VTAASEELTAFTKRYLEALVARDTAYVGAHSVESAGCPYLGIGSPPGENWSLADLIDHLGDFPPTEFVGSSPSGCVHGDVAWLTDYPACILPSGEELAMRATVVLVRVDGEWKVAHFHVSEGVPHEI
jgi:hypothetical protein